MVSVTTTSMSAAPNAPVPATAESAVLFLEHLTAECASGGGEASAGLRENEGLRKRLLAAMEKLVPELETPPETGQRVLYGVLDLTIARIGTDLNIFTILAESAQPLSTAELAERTGADPDVTLLTRLLRQMAAVGQVREMGVGTWTASNCGRNLASPGLAAGACHKNDNVLPAWAALPSFLRRHRYRVPAADKADTAFAQGHGGAGTESAGPTFFDFLRTRPDNARSFHTFMAGAHRAGMRTWLDRPDVLEGVAAAFERSSVGEEAEGRAVFVDVGGGMGHQCAALKKRWPALKGRVILQDREEVVAKSEVKDGIEKMGIDFFETQPVKGAAAYYMRNVLRDWPDDSCRTVLGHIRDVMDAHSFVIIDDLVLPDCGVNKAEMQLDMTMLPMLNGEARSESQWRQLLGDAGLEVVQVALYGEGSREGVVVAKRRVS